MDPQLNPDRVALRLAERLIQLLDEGSFTATYKYAVLIGLMDLCLEQTTARGIPPNFVTTQQLAEKVIELYWLHCTPYGKKGVVLRQNRQGTQVEIVTRILAFRKRLGPKGGALSPVAAARVAAKPWKQLVQFVEWKLVEMPLPKLQFVGGQEDRFLYDYYFPRNMENSAPLHSYWEDGRGTFDNRLVLQPSVGAGLVALNGVLRPLVHREWAIMVARINKLGQALLEDFLFGAERISLVPVRDDLAALQGGRCFYCGTPLGGEVEVDHFIPWSRHPDNGIHNLVVTDVRCNNRKRAHFAAADHVERWRQRSATQEFALTHIAERTKWELRPERTFGVARAIYNMLPDDTPLWQGNAKFVGFAIDRPRIMEALTT